MCGKSAHRRMLSRLNRSATCDSLSSQKYFDNNAVSSSPLKILLSLVGQILEPFSVRKAPSATVFNSLIINFYYDDIQQETFSINRLPASLFYVNCKMLRAFIKTTRRDCLSTKRKTFRLNRASNTAGDDEKWICWFSHEKVGFHIFTFERLNEPKKKHLARWKLIQQMNVSEACSTTHEHTHPLKKRKKLEKQKNEMLRRSERRAILLIVWI